MARLQQIPRVMAGILTGEIYVATRYHERGELTIADKKFPATRDAIGAVIDHARRCKDPECLCEHLRYAAQHRYTVVSNAEKTQITHH